MGITEKSTKQKAIVINQKLEMYQWKNTGAVCAATRVKQSSEADRRSPEGERRSPSSEDEKDEKESPAFPCVL